MSEEVMYRGKKLREQEKEGKEVARREWDEL